MNRPRLTETLAALDSDGYLIDASQEDANQLYLSGFTGPDPFLTLYADGEVHVLVSGLEYGRAKTEAAADTVERHADYDYEYGGREERYNMYAAFVRDKGVESVSMPPRGPVGTADALRERRGGSVGHIRVSSGRVLMVVDSARTARPLSGRRTRRVARGATRRQA
jgi:Xaa-Pro aminopeptidase